LSYDPAAAERVRQLLSGRSDVAEKKMVGGLSFLVNGNMCCGITGMALMVRVGADCPVQPKVARKLTIVLEPQGWSEHAGEKVSGFRLRFWRSPR
jgi:hypothetical protein